MLTVDQSDTAENTAAVGTVTYGIPVFLALTAVVFVGAVAGAFVRRIKR
jgi:hypothetical protein